MSITFKGIPEHSREFKNISGHFRTFKDIPEGKLLTTSIFGIAIWGNRRLLYRNAYYLMNEVMLL